MIRNDRELGVTQERIARFQCWLADLRQSGRLEEFDAVSSGYRLEIERMQAEVLEYLLCLVTVEERVAVGIAASGLDTRSQIVRLPERFSQTAFVGSN